jgi:hypothetical protein
MARGRMLKRSIATSRKIAKSSRSAQWLWLRMQPFTDDYGRLPGDLFDFKNLVLPAENIEEEELEKLLTELHEVRGQSKDRSGLVWFVKNEVVEVTGFRNNQKLTGRPADSLYPDYQVVTGKGLKRLEKVEYSLTSTSTSNSLLKAYVTKRQSNKEVDLEEFPRARLLSEIAEYMMNPALEKKLSKTNAIFQAERFFDYNDDKSWRGIKEGDWRGMCRKWIGNIKPGDILPEAVGDTSQKNMYYCDTCSAGFSAVDALCPHCGNVGV